MTSTPDVEDFTFHMSQDLAAALPLYRLTAMQYDVWHIMLSRMQRGGWVYVTLEEIAEQLGSHGSNVSTAVGKLRERGLLWRESVGRYRINPNAAFRGNRDEWAEALEQLPDDVPEIVLPEYKRRPPRGNSGRRALHVA